MDRAWLPAKALLLRARECTMSSAEKARAGVGFKAKQDSTLMDRLRRRCRRVHAILAILATSAAERLPWVDPTTPDADSSALIDGNSLKLVRAASRAQSASAA